MLILLYSTHLVIFDGLFTQRDRMWHHCSSLHHYQDQFSALDYPQHSPITSPFTFVTSCCPPSVPGRCERESFSITKFGSPSREICSAGNFTQYSGCTLIKWNLWDMSRSRQSRLLPGYHCFNLLVFRLHPSVTSHQSATFCGCRPPSLSVALTWPYCPPGPPPRQPAPPKTMSP